MALNYDIRREAHAIGEFSATMKFASPVTPHTFAKVMQLLEAEAKRLDLPAPMHIQILNLAINDRGMAPAISLPAPVSGGGFQRFAANGEVACGLRCDPDAITLTLREYDRWATVLPMIVETFSMVAAGYLAEVPAIRSFGVQYLNEFRGKDPAVKTTSELFVSDSKWIAPFSAQTDQPWHCHVGQFVPSDGPHRHLINVNCDIAPNSVLGSDIIQNYARVLIFAALTYDVDEHGPLITDVDSLQKVIATNFDNAHSLEKRILGEVISPEYLAIMGEGASEH